MRVDSVSPVLGLSVIPRRGSDPGAHQDLIKAVAAINRSELLGQDRELTLTIDRESRRPVLKILDSVTGDVISQIPGEQALRMAEQLRLAAAGGAGNGERG